MSSKIKSDFRKLGCFEICILQEILKKAYWKQARNIQ